MRQKKRPRHNNPKSKIQNPKSASLLIALALLSGCATRTWTERTDETRPLGESETVTLQRPLTDRFYEAYTQMEEDGHQWVQTVNTSADGEIEINLLPAALQCLVYDHDVTIELYAFESGEVEFKRVVNAATAWTVIEEWSVQARLGADVPLKRKQADLLNKLMRKTERPEVFKQLEAIKEQVTIRYDWE